MTSQTITGHLLSLDGTQPVALTLDADGILTSLASDPGAAADLLSPAFLDIHCHGAVGEDVMSATPAGFTALGRFLASRGVGSYLPTTVTATIETLLSALDRIAAEIDRIPRPGHAVAVAVHLEGPFLSAAKRGVHPAELLQAPSIELFDCFQQAARGHIRLITLAPELPGALSLIRHVVGLGVRVSLGHTNATAAETLAAIDAGATGATHTFNAMRALDHREPGVLGITLDDNRLFAELIADRVHVAPAMVRLWYRAKGEGRAILVTDCMQATGRGPGSYTLGGLPVTVLADRALLSGDLAAGKETLAGSILTLDRAVENLREITHCGLSRAVHAATVVPAALLGLAEIAILQLGQPISLNRYNPAGKLLATCLRGEWVQTG